MLALRRKIIWKSITRERHVIPLYGEEGTFFLNVVLPMAYSKLYRESGPNKMAPLALILWKREQEVTRSSLVFFLTSVPIAAESLIAS